jgi:hypothetical protein
MKVLLLHALQLVDSGEMIWEWGYKYNHTGSWKGEERSGGGRIGGFFT